MLQLYYVLSIFCALNFKLNLPFKKIPCMYSVSL